MHLTIIKQHATSKTNPGKYRVRFIMFINVWNCFVQLYFTVNQLAIGMQVNIHQSFFANPLQQPFYQTFLLPKFFTVMVSSFLCD